MWATPNLHVATTSSTIMRVKGFVECTHPSVPPMYIKPNTLVDLAEEVKKHGAQVPVMATGGITDPLHAEEIIAQGRADMMALARTLIADPHWARKAQEEENIVPCIPLQFLPRPPRAAAPGGWWPECPGCGWRSALHGEGMAGADGDGANLYRAGQIAFGFVHGQW